MRKLLLLLIIACNCTLLHAKDLSISFSARSPIVDDVEYDYEYRVKLEDDDFLFDVLFEREVGIYGYGLDFNSIIPVDLRVNKKKLKVEIEWYNRQVRDIDYRNMHFRYPLQAGNIKGLVGLSLNNMNDEKGIKALLSVKLKYKKIIKFSYQSDFMFRRIVSFNLSKKIYDKTAKYFIEPLVKFKSANGIEFWQAKVGFGIVL